MKIVMKMFWCYAQVSSYSRNAYYEESLYKANEHGLTMNNIMM